MSFVTAHTNDIIKMVFEYLQMLRTVGPQERIWREEQKIQEIKFRFRDKEKPLEYAQGLAVSMQVSEIETSHRRAVVNKRLVTTNSRSIVVLVRTLPFL